MNKKFPVNEIFTSLQGEGYYVGTAAVFIRFSGCNLRCSFCDTDHSAHTLMTIEQIVDSINKHPARHVVLTGGEPGLYVTEEFIEALHNAGRYVAIETNGTRPLPASIDWITLSPKDHSLGSEAAPVLCRADELKVIYTGNTPETYSHIAVTHRFLQPCDTGDTILDARLRQEAITYCLSHPEWRLSLQTHKLIGIR